MWGRLLRDTSFRGLQQCAIGISIISIVYNGLEGGVSIGLGAEKASLALISFGVQSSIEVASAIMVLWRFWKVAKPGEERSDQINAKELRIEKVASFVIAILLGLLALGTVVTAIVGLSMHEEPDKSLSSLIISSSALVCMIFIWLPKRYLARKLNSSAMQGEAVCSLSCIQITIVLFIGSLIFRVWSDGWWLDDATSLILAILFARESYRLLTWVMDPEFNGGCCKTCTTGPTSEISERYLDICPCCEKNDDCKRAGACVCTDINFSQLATFPEVTCCPANDPTSLRPFEQVDGCEDPSMDGIRPCQPTKCCQPVDVTGSKCCSHTLKVGRKPGTLQQQPPVDDCCTPRLRAQAVTTECTMPQQAPKCCSACDSGAESIV